MDEGAEVDVHESCRECGMKRAVVRSGFLYCVECGMRSAESQPLLDFTYENLTGAMSKSTKLGAKKKKPLNELSNMWSTWHAHNMILIGLVEEMTMCGANETLSGVVLRLWSRWLRYNKVAFFSRKHNEVPQLTLGFKPRDLNLLYGIKKTRKRLAVNASPKVKKSQKSKAMKTLNAYVKQQHQKMLRAQSSAAPMASQNLEDITYGGNDELKEVVFNPKTKKLFKKKLLDDFDVHIREGYCSSGCKCFRHRRALFKNRRNKASIFNLYALLYLGLMINNDDIHLGDMLRWCREAHITFGNYKHFFLEDMTISPTDKLSLSSNMMSHKNILYTAGKFAKMFGLNGIKAPDMAKLIKRYIEELELPHELYGLILKILSVTPKAPDFYPYKFSLYPNYEAIALSYIIISLKMLFGLDGVSETKISEATETCNNILSLGKHRKESIKFAEQENHCQGFRRLFNFQDWMKYIEYRKVSLSQCHYPTKVRVDPNGEDDPDLFLFHKNKTRKVQPDGVVKDSCQSMIKSLLQRVEDNYKHENEKQFPTFSCSLTPMASNVSDLLTWQYLNTEYSSVVVNTDILDEDFTLYNLSFLVNPHLLKEKLLDNGYLLYTHVYETNPDIIVEPKITRTAHSGIGIKLKNIILVMPCESHTWEGVLMAEKLTDVHKANPNELRDSTITLNFSNKKRNSLRLAKKQSSNKIPIDLFLCFEHYWVRHYSTVKKKFSEMAFERELDTYFPISFTWLLRECANMAEMTTLALYNELSKIEKQVMKIGCDK